MPMLSLGADVEENFIVSLHRVNRAEVDKLIPGLVWEDRGSCYVSDTKIGFVTMDFYADKEGE